jgi:integrase
VAVQTIRSRLRLVWSCGGKRYFLYLNLPDSKVNRLVAQQRAKQIEGDIATGNFDESLHKYQPQNHPQLTLTAAELMEQFTYHRQRGLSKLTLGKYKATISYLKSFFGNRLARSITAEDAANFRDYLAQSISPVTLRDRLILARAAWSWALKKKMLRFNPWLDIAVKVPLRKQPKPFSHQEIKLILQTFRADPKFSEYVDFVEFLFASGVRTGEAIGLKWQHVDEDCSRVWIGESRTRGIQKTTKTNRDRTLDLTPRLQAMLQRRRVASEQPDGIIFSSPGGLPINDGNFRRRVWQPVLKQAGVEYRSPYNTRHSFISHALALGRSPVEVAALVGNSPKVIYDHYAGVINRPTLPDFLEE